MSELLERSARYVDEGRFEGGRAVNPMDATLHELADRLALFLAFSHVVALRTDDGTVVFDVSLPAFGEPAEAAIHDWSGRPLDTVVYTHGHADHVGGMGAFLAAADERGEPRPTIVGHEAVPERFARYEMTAGYNQAINRRQFGAGFLGSSPFGRSDRWVAPDRTYRDDLALDVGDTRVELHHGRGETDDHTWAWIPSERAICAGDFVIWMFPNAGNPQKVQRYPLEWAQTLRRMIDHEPEMLVPAHGLPVAGAARIRRVLDDTASALESLVHQTLELMNEGEPLDRIVRAVRVPEHLAARPYLQPNYDEPEFVVRNVWRLYGGWYDGNPAHLKPPSEDSLSQEIAALAGGPLALAHRAAEVGDGGDHRLACQLVELAATAAPDDREVHGIRADLYRRRREVETSLMAKGIFRTAAEESDAVASEA